ncbi:MAG: hypothetical protein ACREK7_11410 [Gemmatimonadota bacterium]
MRAPRIAALGLLPLAAACWMERPNLQSTGGGYTAETAAVGPAQADDHAAGTHEDPAERDPAPVSP